MVERSKMPRIDRAKQFAPFDALKGLQDALRLKEFEHERISKGEVQEEQALKMSQELLNWEKSKTYKITYFDDGHYKNVEGAITLLLDIGKIKIGNLKIDLENLFDIETIR